MKKKIFFSITVFALIFAASSALKIKFANASLTKLGQGLLFGESTSSTNLTSSVGWAFLNCKDVAAINGKTCGSTMPDFKVDIPQTDGPVTGFAWIENLQSYIDFQPNGPYSNVVGSTASGVTRVGNTLVGWAKIQGIAGANGISNSAGEDGWVQFNSTTAGWGVAIDAAGVVSGKAWMGNTLGSLDFYNVKIPVAPVLTLNVSPTNTVVLTSGQSLPQTTTLTWTSTVGVKSCTATCKKDDGTAASCAAWSGMTVSNGSTGAAVASVPISDTAVTFSLTCLSTDDLWSLPVNQRIQVGCEYQTCGTGANNGKCMAPDASTFTLAASWNASQCADHCSGNADCALRQTGTWKEVAP
jgi:hypothetical protein